LPRGSLPEQYVASNNEETESAMKAKKNKTQLLKPRGFESWQARQLLKSTQVPNKRAKASKEACRTWRDED